MLIITANSEGPDQGVPAFRSESTCCVSSTRLAPVLYTFLMKKKFHYNCKFILIFSSKQNNVSDCRKSSLVSGQEISA